MALLKRKRIGAGDAMEVVTKFVNACNRHDADGVSACLHPDFDSIQPMYPTRNFRGANQVRRNWQAIFDAEPGFRLTVLRSASADDTVWLELHGAGDEAEVAGIFIMGIVGDRIRWARIYSALVEPVPAGVGEPPPPLQEVPRADARAGGDIEQDSIAPVLDIDRSSRRRRRRRAEEADSAAAAGDEPVSDADESAELPDVAETDAEGEVGATDGEVVAVVDIVPPVASDEVDVEAAVADTEVEAVVIEAGAVIEAVALIEAGTSTVGTDAETVTLVKDETASAGETGDAPVVAVESEPAFVDGLDTEAVPVIVWDEASDESPDDDDSKPRFGKTRD